MFVSSKKKRIRCKVRRKTLFVCVCVGFLSPLLSLPSHSRLADYLQELFYYETHVRCETKGSSSKFDSVYTFFHSFALGFTLPFQPLARRKHICSLCMWQHCRATTARICKENPALHSPPSLQNQTTSSANDSTRKLIIIRCALRVAEQSRLGGMGEHTFYKPTHSHQFCSAGLIAMPFAPSSVLAPSSMARSP